MTAVSDRLDAIQAQLDAATPGPWEVDGMDAGHSRYEINWWVTAGNSGDQICDMDGLNRSRNESVAKDDGRADAEFIAADPENTRYLLDLARKQQAQLDAVRALADQWHARGESDMAFSKTIPDENISIALLTDGATMVENARHIRNALDGAV